MRWSLAICAAVFGLFVTGAASAEQPTDCDRLAGSPTDPNRVGAGVGLYGIEPDVAIPACEKALAADPNNPRLLFNLGRAQGMRSVFEQHPNQVAQGAQSLKAAADQNYPAAQIQLARIYWWGGDDLQQDTRQAMLLLEKAMASDAKEAKRQRRDLFNLLILADHPSKTQMEQIRFAKEAADIGDADALRALGIQLWAAGGKREEIATLWQKAATLGSAHAAFDLAPMYFYGRGGLSKNPQEALRLFEQVEAGDNPEAWSLLAANYERGSYGLPKDDGRAARLYKRASDEGSYLAQYELGRFYEAGKGGLPQDLHEAARLYKLAAEQGDNDAVLALARLMTEGLGGYEADKVKAIEYLRRAARWSYKAREELAKMGG